MNPAAEFSTRETRSYFNGIRTKFPCGAARKIDNPAFLWFHRKNHAAEWHGQSTNLTSDFDDTSLGFSACWLAFGPAIYARSTLQRLHSLPAAASVSGHHAAKATSSQSRRLLLSTACLLKSHPERSSVCSDPTAPASRPPWGSSPRAFGRRPARRGLANSMSGRNKSRSSA